MDWTKLLPIRVHDRPKFTLNVVLAVSTTLINLYLVNYFVFGKNPDPLDYFRSILTAKDKDIFAPEVVLVAIFALIVLWVLAVLLPLTLYFFQTIADHFPFFERTRKFVPEDCLNNLIYQGRVDKVGDDGIRITDSGFGVLWKNYYWKDFLATFIFDFEDLKISTEDIYLPTDQPIRNGKTDVVFVEKKVIKPLNNYIGFIFRALDLDNYFMVSIGIKQTISKNNKGQTKKEEYVYLEKLVITPHIRVDGKWEVFSPKLYPDDNISTQRVVLKKGDNTCYCRVQGSYLVLGINSKEEIFKWNLPTNSRVNYIEEDRKQLKDSSGFTFGNSTTISFRNTYGMIGFRAYGEEHVIVKEINITRL